jgi:hypothetical protein
MTCAVFAPGLQRSVNISGSSAVASDIKTLLKEHLFSGVDFAKIPLMLRHGLWLAIVLI